MKRMEQGATAGSTAAYATDTLAQLRQGHSARAFWRSIRAEIVQERSFDFLGVRMSPPSSFFHYCFIYILHSGMSVLPSVQLPGLCTGEYDPRPFANCTVRIAPFKS